jgi:hypothetical protein
MLRSQTVILFFEERCALSIARYWKRRKNVMPQRSLEPGDMVTLLTKDWNGLVGVVSQAITESHPGHVLVYKDGCIFGVKVSIQDIILADSSNQGFAQLAYHLIRLGSHVIEKRLLV